MRIESKHPGFEATLESLKNSDNPESNKAALLIGYLKADIATLEKEIEALKVNIASEVKNAIETIVSSQVRVFKKSSKREN